MSETNKGNLLFDVIFGTALTLLAIFALLGIISWIDSVEDRIQALENQAISIPQ